MNLTKETENDEPVLKFSPLARTDIKQTWDYLSDRSEDAAKKLIRGIIEKCGVIAKNPKLGRERNELMINLRLFPYKNYNIFYFQIENGVEIYRVLHSSRDIIQIFDDVIDESK